MNNIETRPFAPDQLDDWLAFFDADAFPDNPEWGACYCRCYVFGKQGADAWDAACERGDNRSAMIDEARAGQLDGILARRDGTVVGWLHCGPAERFVSPMGPLAEPEADHAAIVCFIVAPGARGQGVARTMLRAALEELRARGFTSVEGRGHLATDESAAEQFTGPLALYLSEGFVEVERVGERMRVRRPLGQGG